MSRERCAKRISNFLRHNVLIKCMILSMFLGIGLGCIFRTLWSPLQKRKIAYLRFPGEIMFNTLRMVSVPLIVSGVVSSLASLSMRTSGSIGLRALVYYLVTTLCAVVTGTSVAVIVHPGRNTAGVVEESVPNINQLDSFLDMIRNAFPDNIVAAIISKKRTVVKEEIREIDVEPFLGFNNSEDGSHIFGNTSGRSLTIEVPGLVSVPGTNMLGLIVFSILIGCILSVMEEKAKPLTDLFRCMYQVVMRMIAIFVWFIPVGLIFLIASTVVQTERPLVVLQELAIFFPTVVLSLLLHAFGSVPLLYFLVTRKNPYIFIRNMSKALLTAFGTSSSAVTLPVTMDCLVNKNTVDSRVVNFITPIGAIINMDGTALYIPLLTIFISQRLGMTLDFGNYFIIGVTAVAISIGAAGAPGMGIITMTIASIAVGLPGDQILLVAPIDWIIEMFRTVVNVNGDSLGAGIVNHLSSKVLNSGTNGKQETDAKDRSGSINLEESEGLV